MGSSPSSFTGSAIDITTVVTRTRNRRTDGRTDSGARGCRKVVPSHKHGDTRHVTVLLKHSTPHGNLISSSPLHSPCRPDRSSQLNLRLRLPFSFTCLLLHPLRHHQLYLLLPSLRSPQGRGRNITGINHGWFDCFHRRKRFYINK